jgi:hypothetical protein
MAGAVAFETEHFGEESPGFPRVLEGNRCGGYRSEILQSRLSSEDKDKTDLGPHIGIADCTVVPQPGPSRGLAEVQNFGALMAACNSL